MQTAKNYAQALAELTENNIRVQEEILNEIKTLNEAIKQVDESGQFFENPLIPKEKKKEIIKKTFQDKINQKCLNLLLLLIDKQRFYILSDIQNELTKIVNKNKGIVVAEISSAAQLDTQTTEKIKERLEATFKKVSIEPKVEPELIGGIVVKINDLVYDGSIKGRIESLKRRLLG